MDKKPYHHLPDGTFRNPEGSPVRDTNFKWSFKVFNKEKKKLDMTVPKEHIVKKEKVLSDLEKLKDNDYIAWIGHATYIIKLGNTFFKVLFTPGHSPGHICLLNTDQEKIIAGDVLFFMSIGRTDLPGSNHNDLIKSIKTKLFTLDDNIEVLCGHGNNTSIGFEKTHNPFLK